MSGAQHADEAEGRGGTGRQGHPQKRFHVRSPDMFSGRGSMKHEPRGQSSAILFHWMIPVPPLHSRRKLDWVDFKSGLLPGTFKELFWWVKCQPTEYWAERKEEASASGVPGLKACATMPGSFLKREVWLELLSEAYEKEWLCRRLLPWP